MAVPQGRRTAAGLAAALGLLTGCLAHPVYRQEPLARPSPPADAAVRVLVFGDFGYDSLSQRRTAAAMRRAAKARPFDLAVELGDNLYRCGPDPLRAGAAECAFAADGVTVASFPPPPDDPGFAVNENALGGFRARDGKPLPFFLALGNHDVGLGGGRCLRPPLAPEEAERRRACLSVAHRGPAWSMPARHYVVDRGPLRLIVVDTDVVVRDYGGFTLGDEAAFVRGASAPCRDPGRVCLLAGHHPPAAAATNPRQLGAVDPSRMRQLLAVAPGVRAFLAGHVHALQHLSLEDLDVFVSGSTAMGGWPADFVVYWPASAQVRFATTAWGFAELEVHAGGYGVRFLDDRGEPLHCCAAGAEGACLPVVCR